MPLPNVPIGQTRHLGKRKKKFRFDYWFVALVAFIEHSIPLTEHGRIDLLLQLYSTEPALRHPQLLFWWSTKEFCCRHPLFDVFCFGHADPIFPTERNPVERDQVTEPASGHTYAFQSFLCDKLHPASFVCGCCSVLAPPILLVPQRQKTLQRNFTSKSVHPSFRSRSV